MFLFLSFLFFFFFSSSYSTHSLRFINTVSPSPLHFFLSSSTLIDPSPIPPSPLPNFNPSFFLHSWLTQAPSRTKHNYHTDEFVVDFRVCLVGWFGLVVLVVMWVCVVGLCWLCGVGFGYDNGNGGLMVCWLGCCGGLPIGLQYGVVGFFMAVIVTM